MISSLTWKEKKEKKTFNSRRMRKGQEKEKAMNVVNAFTLRACDCTKQQKKLNDPDRNGAWLGFLGRKIIALLGNCKVATSYDARCS
jgi:hypothetical protein